MALGLVLEVESGIEMNCGSCGVNVEVEENWVEFDCPSCGKDKICRCWRCKKIVNHYTCGKCGFVGP